MERAAPAFAVAFAIFYVLAFTFNYTPFTYFPALNEIKLGVVPGSDTVGPPIFWYGWLVYSILAGLVGAAVALVLPAKLTEKAWSLLVWLVPLVAIAYMSYEARHWFTYNLAG